MSKQSELFAQFLAEGKGDGLTQREARVAILIVDGIHPKTIAAQFQVTPERIRAIANKAAVHIRRIRLEEKRIDTLATLKAAFPNPLDIPLDDVPFPIAIHYRLMNLGVTKLGDIVNLGMRGLWRAGGIGTVYTKTIRETLAVFGLELPIGPSRFDSSERSE